jgi:hypothetical protein
MSPEQIAIVLAIAVGVEFGAIAARCWSHGYYLLAVLAVAILVPYALAMCWAAGQ